MNGSSNSNFSQSLQQPSNVAMVASVLAHGILFTGLTFIPATGQQNTRKPLRVISLLQPSANQPAPSNPAIDPNAPPPAPGVAGLPLNITTPDGLAELPITDTPNPAFDPFASDILNVPPPPPQADTPSPFDPEAALAELPPPSPPPQAPPANPPVNDLDSDQADKEFEDWLNGTGEFRLPNLADVRADSSSSSPSLQTNSEAKASAIPSRVPSNINAGRSTPSQSDDFQEGTAPPAQSEKRTVSYAYPQAACADRLEGKAEYRIWVSPQGTPVVSSIVVSTNSDILDRAVNAEAKKYVIKPNDANKILVLPFDFKHSQADCKAKNPPQTQPKLEEPQLAPDSIPPIPKPITDDTDDQLPRLAPPPSTDKKTPRRTPIQSPRSTPQPVRPNNPATQPPKITPATPPPAVRAPAATPPLTPTPIPVKPITLPGATPTSPANTPKPVPIKPVPPAVTPPTSRPVPSSPPRPITPPPSRPITPPSSRPVTPPLSRPVTPPPSRPVTPPTPLRNNSTKPQPPTSPRPPASSKNNVPADEPTLPLVEEDS